MNHDTQLANLGAMAANVGGYRTAQADQEMALQQQAADLHRQQVMDAIQGGQQREAVNALQYVMGDQRQREINAMNAGTRLATTDLAGQYGLQREQAQQEGANTRTADQVSAREREGQANRDNRQTISNDRNGVTTRGQDLQNGLGYDRIQAQQDLAGQRQRERVALEAARTAEQALRRQGETQKSTMLAQLHAAISEKQRQRSILETRARNGDGQAAQYISQLNGEIKGLVDRIMPPSPSPSPYPAAPTPSPYDAQQPGMAQPAPDMNNLMQQPVDAPGPQSMAPPPVLSHPQLGSWQLRGIGADGQPMYERVA